MLSIAIQHFIVAVTEANARKTLRANSKMRRRSLIPHLVKYTRKAYTNKKKTKDKNQERAKNKQKESSRQL